MRDHALYVLTHMLNSYPCVVINVLKFCYYFHVGEVEILLLTEPNWIQESVNQYMSIKVLVKSNCLG